MMNTFTKRGIAVALAALLLLAPLTAVTLTTSVTPVTAQSAGTTGQPGEVTTGRPVDSINLERSGGRLSVLVTDDQPTGTPLRLDRDWLRSELGRPVPFMRFHRNGKLVDSYRLTPQNVIIDIPHFSTQNITATVVDAQFEVSGSASGQETTRVINYDVNSTQAAVLEIHGQGDRLGDFRVDQRFVLVDNSTYTKDFGEIPHNVSFVVEGRGQKIGPPYNKSFSSVTDGSTQFFDLEADDWPEVNITTVGAGQKNGTRVIKGPFNGSGDDDTKTLTFNFEQNNESIVFRGITTTGVTNQSDIEEFNSDNSTNSENITISGGQLSLKSSQQIETIHAQQTNGSTFTSGSGAVDWTVVSDAVTGDGVPSAPTVDHFQITNASRASLSTGVVAGEFDGDNAFHVSVTDGPNEWQLTLVENTAENSVEVYESGITQTIYELKCSLTTDTFEVDLIEGTLNGTPCGFTFPGSVGEPFDIRYRNGDLIQGDYILANVTEGGNTGFYERQYSTSNIINNAKLNWTDNETNGNVQYFVKTDDNSYVEWTDAENDTLKDITDGQNVWIRVNLTKTSADGPTVERYGLLWQNETTTKTKDPAIDIDGDGANEASFSGILNDSETVVVPINESIAEGQHTFTVHTSGGSSVDWEYDGNNEARAHVKNVTLNGISYPINQFLNKSELNITVIDRLDTLLGQNSITVNLYSDSETQLVDRLDVRGRYEGRTILANATVESTVYDPVDVALADGQSHTFNVTSDVAYGSNDFRVDLAENSTQNEYDLSITWNPENRTLFSNVTVNGVDFEGPDEYSGVPYNATFLNSSDVLTFNVTDVIAPGNNDHTFRMLAPRTTTDSLTFVEKVEFHKNVSVTIEEAWATYNKSSTQTFNHTVTTGAFFNFSVPNRVTRLTSTSVTFNGTTPAANTTVFNGTQIAVQVNEEIPNSTTVDVRVTTLKYTVVNATDSLRNENPHADPYLVDVGVTSVSGNVSYNTTEVALTTPEYEVILTNASGGIDTELTNGTFNGNVTIPEGHFNTHDGFMVRRPKHSTDTFTGVVNVIHPSEVVRPNRTVVHQTPLYAEPDESYIRMDNYSVSDLTSPLSVEWKQVGPYHLSWVTNETTDPVYDQRIESVTSEGVSVFADGQRYTDIDRVGDDLVIHVNGSTTWDVFQYDFPRVISDTNVSIDAGRTEAIQVVVDNPNNFTLHDTRLVVSHGWIEEIDPIYHDIPANGNATYNVTIHVPFGTEATEYAIPMNVTSTETGEVSTKDINVNVGGGLITAGVGIPNIALVALGVLVLIGLLTYQAHRSGELEKFRRNLEEL